MRRLSFAAAAFVVAAPILGAVAVHGCSSGEQFESVCLWVADPDNCYRKFRADSVDNGETCKPLGDPSPVNLADATNPNGNSNGSFLARDKLDVCYIAGGGQVVFDPPIDLTTYPPSALADPITYKITFKRPNGTDCGAASYTSPHGFSFTINAPPDAGATTSADAGTTTVDAGADAGVPTPYGTYTQVIQPGRDAFDATCPSGESHHFNLYDVNGLSATADGGAQTQCPVFTQLVPQASFVVNPGGIDAPGAVSFTIYWPPTDVTYPTEALEQGPAIQPVAVTYFNCSIGAAPQLCFNGEKDPNETDVDCGGSEISPGCPQRCGDGQGCVTDCDCDPSLVCNVVAGVRQCGAYYAPDAGAGGAMPTTPPTRDCSSVFICQNGKKDGAESDVDCGGPDCGGCANGKACTADSDCAGGYCLSNVCSTATCSDTVKNQGESDVDCGGANCMPCADGKTCTTATDCSSGNCLNGVCSTPNCSDGVKDGSETDVDCGGACATSENKQCANLKACSVNGDCESFGCVNGTCLVPTCTDKVMDGAESDVDCGAACPLQCDDNKLCTKDADCKSGVCGTNVLKCYPAATCAGDGGAHVCGTGCDPCSNGAACTQHSDCLSQTCIGNVCTAPTCSDMVKNASETDTDCGGGTCPACAVGKACMVNSDCAGLMACVNNICQ
jgi:hypothetical protein